MKLVTDNRKAHFDYFIEDKFEAGMELLGWEVKSARAGSVNLQDSFVTFKENYPVTDAAVPPLLKKGNLTGHPECFLKNAHFSPYENGDVPSQETRRDRRLLLNRSEINKLCTAVKTKGYTCIATKIYFNKQGRVKIEIALAKGKHTYDKKKTLKERDIARETSRVIANEVKQSHR